MAEPKSLLSLIARGYAAGREDAATEALCFIVSRSASARAALSEFLGLHGDPLTIASFRTQFLTDGAYPDMVCLDEHGNRVAFIESKFWAPLTHSQPVTYWKELADDRPGVLLFLAPATRLARTDEESLWDELVKRLRCAGHELGPMDYRDPGSLVTAPSKDGQRRLMLTSWHMLLDRLTQRTVKDADFKACFEVAELRGLAQEAIKDDDPVRDKNLKRLIADAVKHLKESGWADDKTSGSTELKGVHYVKYFRLRDTNAGLRIDYKTVKQTGRPLWLQLRHSSNSRRSVDMDDVRSRWSALDEPGLQWQRTHVHLPIDLLAGADCQATLHAVVAELERIAEIIHLHGLSHRSDPTTG